ncbi:CDC27 protein [Coemansia sp. RSA 2049]|nr:CDC27 protein [Coemansia sp. RSA 2049]
MNTADEVLGLLVLHESQVVTYRRLSRELGVHVNTAKQQLAEFHAKNTDKCHATYLVTGTTAAASSTNSGLAEIQVSLVPEAMLSDAQQALTNPAWHVYSLECRAVDDAASYVMANVQAGNNRDMDSLWAVQSSVSRVSARTIEKSVDYSECVKPVVKKEPAAAATPEADVKPAVIHSPSDSESAGKETAAPVKSSTLQTRSVKSFFGRARAVKPKASPKESQSDESQNTESQNVESQNKESQEVESQEVESQLDDAHKNDTAEQSDADLEMQSVEGDTNPEARQRIEDMFDDDDNEADEDEGIAIKDEAAAYSGMAMAADTDVEMAGDSDHNMDSAASPGNNDTDQQLVAAAAEDEDADEDGESSSYKHGLGDGANKRRIRKRRKVSKVKHTKNKRGMLVSQVVDEWESYSESESDGGNAATSAVAAKREQNGSSSQEHDATGSDSKQQVGSRKTKGAGAPQRSILSFFGKK